MCACEREGGSKRLRWFQREEKVEGTLGVKFQV